LARWAIKKTTPPKLVRSKKCLASFRDGPWGPKLNMGKIKKKSMIFIEIQ
jgi:hypothetical protein